MKKILFALGIMMALGHTASAQDSKYAKNYKVCRSESGYEVCPSQTTSNLNGEATPQFMDHQQILVPVYSPTMATSRPPAVPAPRMVKEHPMEKQNDGMEQNNRRNLNVSNNMPLAPSTGEIR